ncbi:39S ribosomal protein L53/MRP-L53-domain-containing protein [Aspergillus egyptiacus]|nr:39S ribosomal protein L53/MRP-L53-domain-containing protein [Aspergillus egyptiacus]
MTIPLQTITSLRTSFNPFLRSARPCRLLLSLLRNPTTVPSGSGAHIDIKVTQLPRNSTKEPQLTVTFKGGKELNIDVGKRQMKIGDVVEEIARVGRIIEREESLKGN